MLALALKPIDLTFQEDGHVHLLRGLQVPGCTSISGLFQDDWWKFAWPVKLMYEKAMGIFREEGAFDITVQRADEVLKKCKNAWREKRDKSADTGTLAHGYIEDYIKSGIKIPTTVSDEIKNCFNEFIRWEAQHNPTWLGCEIQVGSERHNYAGILDALATIDGKTVLVDFKTSSGIKPEYNIQLAGLQMALEEMGCHVDQRAILHLPKIGEYEYRIITSDLKKDQEAFLAGLEFFHHKNLFMARNKKEKN